MGRFILDVARLMMLGTKPEKDMWSKNVLTAVYIIDGQPTSCLQNKTPVKPKYLEIAGFWLRRLHTYIYLNCFERTKTLKPENHVDTFKILIFSIKFYYY